IMSKRRDAPYPSVECRAWRTLPGAKRTGSGGVYRLVDHAAASHGARPIRRTIDDRIQRKLRPAPRLLPQRRRTTGVRRRGAFWAGMFAETTASRANFAFQVTDEIWYAAHAHQAARPLTPSRVFLSSASLANCS